ncbi:MAG: molybdopterin-dependent oxidoreductase, partial [Arenicellales bacterium]|nr:molybdopterin-dependent oxidoreductase [Arenicellales bacterium]
MVSNTGTRRSAARSDLIPTATHWGNYLLERCDGNIVAVHPYSVDAEPSAIGQSLIEAQDPSCRIPQPMIRQGYLKSRWESDGEGRGRDPFVPVSWKEAIELAAAALEHTRSEYGNEAIYGGSYGWSSAGRFHHAQSQIHRFLSTIGGYTYSVNTYSLSAAENILPHVVGRPDIRLQFEAPTVEDMVANTGLVVGFGGIATKNAQVMSGGLGAHTAERQLQALRRANVDFINISPIRDDMVASLGAEWWPCRPNADVAIMLGIAHTLATEELVDHAFVQRYCVGYERFLDYLLGSTDNRPKNAVWASTLAEVSAEKIRNLARRMAKTRTVLGVSWSLQRAEHGEQPYWMVTTLAAMLGYIGLPGGGIAYGYGSVHNIGFGGRRIPPFDVGSLPRGKNLVTKHIPVSRIADMLLHPGESIDFNGQTVTFPDIKTIYWAGGNPFHHHQDL